MGIDGMDAEELTEKICREHAEYCKSRKNKPVGCAGQTVQNVFSASKCYGCPYYTDYSCAVKFAVEYLRKRPPLRQTTAEQKAKDVAALRAKIASLEADLTVAEEELRSLLES